MEKFKNKIGGLVHEYMVEEDNTAGWNSKPQVRSIFVDRRKDWKEGRSWEGTGSKKECVCVCVYRTKRVSSGAGKDGSHRVTLPRRTFHNHTQPCQNSEDVLLQICTKRQFLAIQNRFRQQFTVPFHAKTCQCLEGWAVALPGGFQLLTAVSAVPFPEIQERRENSAPVRLCLIYLLTRLHVGPTTYDGRQDIGLRVYRNRTHHTPR